MDRTFRKVPQILAIFWVIKVLTTALGESTSDYLVYSINPYVAVGLGAVGFVIAMALQLRARRYNPWIYWFAVTMVAVFGTMAADVVHIALGVPYEVSTAFFAIVLAAVFWAWWHVEKTLSIHSIFTVRREVFYWLTVITTFVLGTAAGDMTAISLNLGYFASGLVYGGLIAFVALMHHAFKGVLAEEHLHESKNGVLAFWLAYILTRPLGASFADWFRKSHNVGGLGWGDGVVSAILAVLIVICVAYLSISKADVEK